MKKLLPLYAVLIPDNAQKVFNGEIFEVYQWPQERFDGSVATFEMLKRPDSVLFIVVRDNKLLFIEEEQPNKPLRLRLPGGRVDPGEDWLRAARRECLEELGLSLQNWKLLYVDQPASKIEWFCATYLATEVTAQTDADLDAGERIRLCPLSFEEAKQKVMGSDDSELNYLWPLFDRANSLEELISLPEFSGKVVDRP